MGLRWAARPQATIRGRPCAAHTRALCSGSLAASRPPPPPARPPSPATFLLLRRRLSLLRQRALSFARPPAPSPHLLCAFLSSPAAPLSVSENGEGWWWSRFLPSPQWWPAGFCSPPSTPFHGLMGWGGDWKLSEAPAVLRGAPVVFLSRFVPTSTHKEA